MGNATELFDQVGNVRKKAASVLVMAKCFQQADQLQESVQACEAAVALCQQGRDKRGQANALLLLANVNQTRQSFGGAASRFEEASFLFRSLKDKREEAKATAAQAAALVKMYGNPKETPARGHFKDEEFDLCIERAKAAIALFGDDSLECGGAMLSEASALKYAKKYDDSKAKTMECIQLFEARGDLAGQAAAYVNLGEIFFYKEDKDAALEAAEKARDLAEQAGAADVQKKANGHVKTVGTMKGRGAKKAQGDTPKMIIDYYMPKVDAQIITITDYEGRAMRTGKPPGSSSLKPGDKGYVEPARQKVFFNLRMQRVPGVDMTTMPIAA